MRCLDEKSVWLNDAADCDEHKQYNFKRDTDCGGQNQRSCTKHPLRVRALN